MTKQVPGWSGGTKVAKQVASARATGNPIRQTPHFVPETAPGKPKAGVSEPFTRRTRKG